MSFKSTENLLTGFVSVPLMSKLLITSVLITSFLEENFNDKSTNYYCWFSADVTTAAMLADKNKGLSLAWKFKFFFRANWREKTGIVL